MRHALAAIDAAADAARAGHYPNFVETPADASAFLAPDTRARLRTVNALWQPPHHAGVSDFS